MSVEGALAVTRLVDLCETFHLPIVSLTDQGGLTIGRVAEERGTIRHGARAIAAIYQARVPQAELIVRRVYGVGGAGHRQPAPGRPELGLALGGLGLAAGAGRRRGGVPRAARAGRGPGGGDRADPPASWRRSSSPFRTAERFGVQDLIDPRDCQAAAVRLGPRRLPGAARADRPPLLRHPPLARRQPQQCPLTHTTECGLRDIHGRGGPVRAQPVASHAPGAPWSTVCPRDPARLAKDRPDLALSSRRNPGFMSTRTFQ